MEEGKGQTTRACVCFVDIALFFFFIENEFPREFSQELLVPCRYKQCVIAAYQWRCYGCELGVVLNGHYKAVKIDCHYWLILLSLLTSQSTLLFAVGY